MALYIDVLRIGPWKLDHHVGPWKKAIFHGPTSWSWCKPALTWPPQPPYLNPMKHLWALVKQKLNEYPSLAKGMLQLWEHVQACFHSIAPK